MTHREEIIGVLAVAEIGNDRKYTAADTRLLELLASQAASAIQNARLRAELETGLRATVSPLATLVGE